MLSDSAILKKLERLPKRTAGYKQLVRELGLHGDARRDLSDRLERLVAGGPNRSGRVGPLRPSPSRLRGKNMVVGKLSMHRDGFGFVIPDPASLKEPLKSRLSGDIFIPPPAVGTAMHGDVVLVEIVNLRPDGRAEGRIIRPVNRAHSHGGRHLPLRRAPQLRRLPSTRRSRKKSSSRGDWRARICCWRWRLPCRAIRLQPRSQRLASL